MRRVIVSPTLRALLALMLVLTLGSIFHAHGAFLHLSTHRDALRQASVHGILAAGMTLVIVSGGIDLSVGSVVALVAVVASTLAMHLGAPSVLTVGAALAVGASCGAISGALVARAGVQPFVATLAMMVFARGLAKFSSGGMKVSTAVRQADGSYQYVDVPPLFRFLDQRVLFDNVSVVTLVFAGCIAAVWVVLSCTVFGRRLYAVGGNEQAARYAGVPVSFTKIAAYAGCGLLAAVAGLCQAAQEQQGDPETGVGYELTAIAMVVMGGTSLAGGRGGAGFTLLGVLTIGYLEKILSINAVPEAGRLVLTGVVLVLAVLVQRSRSR
jgi:ribose transport system permease protein